MLNILYALVWAIAPAAVDYIGVVARNGIYPKVPPAKDRQEFGAFLQKWGPQPPWAPKLVMPWEVPVECNIIDGVVLDVSDKFIEIQPKGGGKPVKFPPHILLATGKVVVWEQDAHAYLLADVKKGDIVAVATGRPSPEDVVQAFYIMIRERPGGRIPPPRKLTGMCMYHRDEQALIDHRDKGTPLPEHLRPKPRPVKAPAPAGGQKSDKVEAVVPAKPTPKSEATTNPASDPPKKKD